MAQFVRTTEVLLQILDHLEEEKEGRKTIVTLARTSSAFHDLAVRRLWKDMPGLWPLLYLFPEGAFEMDEQRGFGMVRFMNLLKMQAEADRHRR
jgi:hypothetical protein